MTLTPSRTCGPDPTDGAVREPLLLVERSLRENGGLRVTHEIARRLPWLGVSTTLFVLQHVVDGGPQLRADPDVDLVFGARRARRLRASLLPVLLRLVRRSRRSAVVMSGSEVGYALLLGWLAARIARRPFAVLVQSSLPRALDEWVPPGLRWLTRWVHAHADLAVCVAPGLVADVVDNGLPPDRVAVVAVGVDVDRVVAAARAAGGTAPGSPYLLAAGRLEPQKGFDVLIRAYAAARERLAGMPLVIVGEGRQRAALESLVRELDLTGLVSLPGFVDDLQLRLSRASLFVLPSRYEGMGGLVLLEAMAHRVPIVAADCPSGPRELLDDGRFGDLVGVDDVAGLSEALADHVQDPDRLRRMAAGGRERARDYSPERWSESLVHALDPHLSGDGGRARR